MHEDRQDLWTAAAAEAATGGQSRGNWRVTGLSIDSRSVAPGDLFIALQGPNFDGHDFVLRALAAGAAAAMVSTIPAGLGPDAPLLVVKDTFQALEALGRAGRLRSLASIAAITGSVGKTGTKEALRHCLAAQAETYATEGSLNNHWGVPLSLSRLAESARYGVFELGMNHAGEIGPLSQMVRPHVAAITTIEPAHMEFFASVEAVADAKAEIFQGMAADGVAVLNRDNSQYARLAAAARAAGLSRVWGFGAHERAEGRLLEFSLHATCSAVTAMIGRERIQYCISLPGRHWVSNSLAVLLTVHALGADVAAAARALSQLQPVKGRGTRRRVRLPEGAFTLIDESYNASPAAMAAAFEVLSRLDPGAGGRRMVALGDMRELGSGADEFHAGLVNSLRTAGVESVYCCGPHMHALWRALPAAMRGDWAEDSAALAPVVAASMRAGDVVLVKGSAGSRMSKVVEGLTALGCEPAEPRRAVAAP